MYSMTYNDNMNMLYVKKGMLDVLIAIVPLKKDFCSIRNNSKTASHPRPMKRRFSSIHQIQADI